MEVESLGELAVGHGCKGASHSAKCTLYSKRVPEETVNRPFDAEKMSAEFIKGKSVGCCDQGNT